MLQVFAPQWAHPRSHPGYTASRFPWSSWQLAPLTDAPRKKPSRYLHGRSRRSPEAQTRLPLLAALALAFQVRQLQVLAATGFHVSGPRRLEQRNTPVLKLRKIARSVSSDIPGTCSSPVTLTGQRGRKAKGQKRDEAADREAEREGGRLTWPPSAPEALRLRSKKRPAEGHQRQRQSKSSSSNVAETEAIFKSGNPLRDEHRGSRMPK